MVSGGTLPGTEDGCEIVVREDTMVTPDFSAAFLRSALRAVAMDDLASDLRLSPRGHHQTLPLTPTSSSESSGLISSQAQPSDASSLISSHDHHAITGPNSPRAKAALKRGGLQSTSQRVLYECVETFSASRSTQLAMEPGNIVFVTKCVDEEWFKGEKLAVNAAGEYCRGIFPQRCVRKLEVPQRAVAQAHSNLELLSMRDSPFSLVWATPPSSSRYTCSAHVRFFKPVPPPGFCALSYVCERVQTLHKSALLEGDSPSAETTSSTLVARAHPHLLRPPVDYELVWSSSAAISSSASASLALWKPLPPPGFVALSTVATGSSDKPAADAIYCVHASAVVEAIHRTDTLEEALSCFTLSAATCMVIWPLLDAIHDSAQLRTPGIRVGGFLAAVYADIATNSRFPEDAYVLSRSMVSVLWRDRDTAALSLPDLASAPQPRQRSRLRDRIFRRAEMAVGALRDVPAMLKRLEKTTYLEVEEIRCLWEIFNVQVPEGVLTLDHPEFFKDLSDQGLKESIFMALDVDRNGVIDFEELMQALSVMTRGKFEERLVYAFRICDLDSDGFIDRQEVQRVASNVGKILQKFAAQDQDVSEIPFSKDPNKASDLVESVFTRQTTVSGPSPHVPHVLSGEPTNEFISRRNSHDYKTTQKTTQKTIQKTGSRSASPDPRATTLSPAQPLLGADQPSRRSRIFHRRSRSGGRNFKRTSSASSPTADDSLTASEYTSLVNNPSPFEPSQHEFSQHEPFQHEPSQLNPTHDIVGS
ncbi:MAG: Vps62-related protein, partial [archaeon]|nr:Vps62-related protein [archaeon]